ncbi:Mitochondrial inner membrane protein OXA1-like [Porphyridium purpureum]|uniref:Mitochondrial inner membrane protein OXA1-like n=1 Tax=Porphyridium purpureum TaxID=35688 RepID=A0A5J4YYG9_PORPP|nr:Mitochondrial inner membrane protein OXA1-like [Porphyridium purpureum]|eukprot:POR3749..scf209_3
MKMRRWPRAWSSRAIVVCDLIARPLSLRCRPSVFHAEAWRRTGECSLLSGSFRRDDDRAETQQKDGLLRLERSSTESGKMGIASLAAMPGVVQTRASSTSEEPSSDQTVLHEPSFDLNLEASVPAMDALTSQIDTKWHFWDVMVDSLQYVHDVSNLPWWATVVVCTCAVRIVLFPVALNAHRNAEKMRAAQPELQELQQKYFKLANEGNKDAVHEFRLQHQEILKKHDADPKKSVIPVLVQAPIFIGAFWALQHMAVVTPGLTHGGVLWFTDLSARDPYLILPVLTGLTAMASFEVVGKNFDQITVPRKEEPTSGEKSSIDTLESNNQSLVDKEVKSFPAAEVGKVMRKAMRAVMILSIPVMSYFPSVLFCYWIPNNLLTFAQHLVIERLGSGRGPRILRGPQFPRGDALPNKLVRSVPDTASKRNPHESRNGTLPQSRDAFFADDSDNTVENTLVSDSTFMQS